MTTSSLHAHTLTRLERSERTDVLLREAQATTDPAHRERLLDEAVTINLGVAEAVANRYRNRGVAAEDLHQAAYEGLVKAVHKFDPTVRPDLLTYAVPTIRGEVQRWFRDQSWMVRPPRRLQERQWQVNRSMERLTQALGRQPTEEELTDDVGCTRAELAEAEAAYGCFQPPSLDRPVGGDDASPTLGDAIADPDEGDRAAAEARATLGPVVSRLNARDQRIIYLRFFEDQSQKDIGAELGVTQMQVSRLIQRILDDLRAGIGPLAVA